MLSRTPPVLQTAHSIAETARELATDNLGDGLKSGKMKLSLKKPNNKKMKNRPQVPRKKHAEPARAAAQLAFSRSPHGARLGALLADAEDFSDFVYDFMSSDDEDTHDAEDEEMIEDLRIALTEYESALFDNFPDLTHTDDPDHDISYDGETNSVLIPDAMFTSSAGMTQAIGYAVGHWIHTHLRGVPTPDDASDRPDPGHTFCAALDADPADHFGQSAD